ncbi:MAG: dnaA [Microvirga sp.]|jgi:hypothetical protein|nr:dnaA [Microvirga sp.]MDF2969575.1 dnaA [Microvirga sp.]
MSAQPIGIVAEQTAKREALVGRLSPAAKHAAFPTLYAQPLPQLTDVQKLRRELNRAQGALDEARAENLRLQSVVDGLQAALKNGYVLPADRGDVGACSATIEAVQKLFLVEYNALSTDDERELMTLADLIGPRRGFALAHPRQVCMWLCAKLCKGQSLPRIGRSFGGKDHTTVMHAKRVAPQRMAMRPDLNLVAIRVFAHFGVSQ